jgi:hypothetical protein
MLYPLCRGICSLAFKIRALLQHGVVGVYLLYTTLTLVLLLTVVVRS